MDVLAHLLSGFTEFGLYLACMKGGTESSIVAYIVCIVISYI